MYEKQLESMLAQYNEKLRLYQIKESQSQAEITKLKQNESTAKEEKLQDYQKLLKENEALISQKELDAKKYEVEMSLKIKTIQKEKDSLT